MSKFNYFSEFNLDDFKKAYSHQDSHPESVLSLFGDATWVLRRLKIANNRTRDRLIDGVISNYHARIADLRLDLEEQRTYSKWSFGVYWS